MTLCVAAACKHEGEPRIVLCTDWKQEMEGIAGAENRNKLGWIKEGWPVLIADRLCHAEALVDEYSKHLKSIDLTGENVLGEAKIPAQLYKRIVANDYIQQLLGVDYDYFLEHGKERFPEEFFRERMDEISRIKLGASLIIAGFVDVNNVGESVTQACLCVVEDSENHQDVVRLETDFAAIGSGAYVATAALFHRSQNWERELMPTIYSVFEAKRFAERVPGVGESLTIDVLAPDGIRDLSPIGYGRCEKLYARFGPRAVRETHRKEFEMRDDFLEAPGEPGTASWGDPRDRAGFEK